MTKEELIIKVEGCLKHSEEMLNSMGSLTPMLDIEIVDNTGHNSLVAVALVLGDGDKQIRDNFIKGLGLTFGAIKRIGKIKEVKCIVMMSEAWFSTPSKAEYELMHGNLIPPSQDPNRREMLMATGLTADGICLMRSKEMFSIEVKGKRHFTLKDVPELKEETGKLESNVLNNFFWGYNKTQEDNEKNRMIDLAYGKFENVTFDELLQRGIKILTQQVGGVKSEFINLKK